MDTARGIEGGSDNTSFAEQSVRFPSSPERTAPLWLWARRRKRRIRLRRIRLSCKPLPSRDNQEPRCWRANWLPRGEISCCCRRC